MARGDDAGDKAGDETAGGGGGDAPGERAADAFSLVGNEHRVAILRALLDAHADPDTAYPTPFARLREQAGIDVSAQFAYHLDELVGAFVADTGDGYRLRYAGWKAAAALAAGTYTHQPAFGPTRIGGDCPHCTPSPRHTGETDEDEDRDWHEDEYEYEDECDDEEATDGSLHASYGDAWLTVACHGCERVLARYPFPPGPAADRLATEGIDGLLSAFDRRVRSHFSLAADGVCPECAGRTTTGLEPVSDPEQPTPTATRGDGHAIEAVADCQQCGNHLTFPVGLLALEDPDVTAAWARHGVRLDDRPFWERPLLAPDALARTGTDPLAATLSIETGGDVAIDVTVTETLAVDVDVNDEDEDEDEDEDAE